MSQSLKEIIKTLPADDSYRIHLEQHVDLNSWNLKQVDLECEHCRARIGPRS